MARIAFVWEGIEHWVMGELIQTLQLISTQEEADSFLLAYSAACESDELALHNIGYMAEILSHDEDANGEEEAKRICNLFDVEFQIKPMQTFGRTSMGLKVERQEEKAA